MLRLKKQNFTRLFISSPLLAFSMISCRTVETGWEYKVIDPYHENTYHHEYAHISYIMNIKLAAKDSALKTYVQLRIITPYDSMKIYPALAYIKSPHFVDSTHFPIDAEYTIEDSIFHKINEDEISNPYFLNKDEKLLVNLIFKSFATYAKSFNSKPISEKSDFILYYDIHNNKQPLTFRFTPDIDTTRKQ
jgi:hypothetical protein